MNLQNERKIREIYDCVEIISDEELYPLQKWYNELIDKSINEITVADVLRMIRQKQFINIAMSRAVKFLQDDVFIGELYDGELLEKISEMDSSFLTPYVNDLKIITENASEKSGTHKWSYDKEEYEFNEIVESLSKKIWTAH